MLSLKQAAAIAHAVIQAAVERGFAALAVTVLDEGGNVLVVLRDERASIYRSQIAMAKAAGCLGMGFGGRELARRAQAMPQFFSALAAVFPNGIVPLPGGALLRDATGGLCGAIGVSGDTSDNDERCAVVGVESVGLVADTGAAAPHQGR